jgi:integrase/recombinase XerD
MLFSKAIEGFLLEAKGGRYSPAHIPTMEGYLRYMCRYLGDPELDSITQEDWKRYMLHLHTDYQPKRYNGDTSPLKLSSIDNHWKTIRGFYNWAAEVLGSPRPDKGLPRPHYDTPQIVPFTEDEVRRLLEACQFTRVVKQNGQTYRIKRHNADRDKAVLLILLDTGIRLGELTRLKVGDVNLENGEVYIRPHRDGRKSRSRTVFLGARTRQAVWRYIAKTQATSDLSIPLIDLKGSTIRQAISRIGENAKVANTHPHRFRHTFAVMFLKQHGDAMSLQRLLGHNDLQMTRRYVNLATSDLAEIHKYASPVDNWRL